MANGLVGQVLRIKQRALWSWEGFVHVYRTEGSLKQWLLAYAVSALLAFALPLSGGERGLLLMGGLLVIAAECLNTAVERIVDDIGTDRRVLARQAKDCGSAAVAITGIAAGIAWLCVLGALVF